MYGAYFLIQLIVPHSGASS